MNKIKSIHQEDISRAYLKMLAAYNDVTKVSTNDRDHDGIDCRLQFSEIEGVDFNPVNIAVQIKSSINVIENGDSMSYAIPSKNYNKFCGKSVEPRIFAILQLPKDAHWVDFDVANSHLLARSKMYWYILPEDSVRVENDNSSVTLKIPKDNYWTVENFKETCAKIIREFYKEKSLIEGGQL